MDVISPSGELSNTYPYTIPWHATLLITMLFKILFVYLGELKDAKKGTAGKFAVERHDCCEHFCAHDLP
mgnify:CR=1 FL=1